MKLKSKRLVILINSSWNIYNFRLKLLAVLKKAGFEIICIAPRDKYSKKLEQFGFIYKEIKLHNKGINPIQELIFFGQLYKLYKETMPNIALHYTIKPNIYGTLVCHFLNIKTINNITGLGTLFIKQNILTKIVKYLYKFSQRSADKIFFQNRNDYEMFINERIVDKNKCDILPGSGVDINKFKPIKVEKEDDIFRFLLIARMLWDKGIGEYMEAARLVKQKYKNVEFLLLGAIRVSNPTAIPEEKIKEWEKEGIVKYLGTTDDVKIEIAKADCIVLPSYREGTSRVLLESAAMAKPIIATDVPGCNNIVEDGVNGLLCRVKNSQDLADKMEKMLNLSEEERIKMGQRGREKVIKEFDERIVIEKYLKAIEELLK